MLNQLCILLHVWWLISSKTYCWVLLPGDVSVIAPSQENMELSLLVDFFSVINISFWNYSNCIIFVWLLICISAVNVLNSRVSLSGYVYMYLCLYLCVCLVLRVYHSIWHIRCPPLVSYKLNEWETQ